MRHWLLVRTASLRLALASERRYSRALEAQLNGEKIRNQAREDELLTIPMRYLRFMGVATREGPAPPVQPLRSQLERRPIPQVSAWASLTDDERAEWIPYKEDTDAAGVPEQQARREFLEMLEMRYSQNDAEIM